MAGLFAACVKRLMFQNKHSNIFNFSPSKHTYGQNFVNYHKQECFIYQWKLHAALIHTLNCI